MFQKLYAVFRKTHANESAYISQSPSDWNGEPDTGRTHKAREDIGQGNTGSKRKDGQNHRHFCTLDCTVIAIQQKKTADAQIACPFYAKVMNARSNDTSFFCADENSHKRCCKEADDYRNEYAEDGAE